MMMQKDNVSKTKSDITSLNQWMDNFGITIARDERFNEIAEDPNRLGIALANSTIDSLIKKRNLTRR